MNAWLPCGYTFTLIVVGMVIAAAAGFWAGRKRGQLALLETFRPET